jgi:hypothetical protein
MGGVNEDEIHRVRVRFGIKKSRILRQKRDLAAQVFRDEVAFARKVCHFFFGPIIDLEAGVGVFAWQIQRENCAARSVCHAPACAAHLLPLHSHLFTIYLFAGGSTPVFGHFGNFFTRSLPDSHQNDKNPD